MTTGETVTAFAVFAAAAALMIFGILQFAERGFLFNNAYIHASEEERKSMNKKPYYRQSAIVFFLLSLTFAVIGLSIVFQNAKLQLIEIPLIVCSVIYAVVSSKSINKREKK